MAVGTTADFTLTRNEIIELALGILGVSEPAQEDYTLGVKVLNSLVRHLDAKGDSLWAIDNTESTLTLVGSQSEYATGVGASLIPANMLKLEYAAILKGSNDRIELNILDRQSAMRTTLKDDYASEPTDVHLERAALPANNKMIFFPTPTSAQTIVFTFRRPLYDFDSATDNPDFPQDWLLPLQKMLAVELAPHYGTPIPVRQILMIEAEKVYRESSVFQGDEPSYKPVKQEYF